MKLSACMIVKNEEEILKKTLPSLVTHIDELIIVDTGSEDNSVNVAKSFGAKVAHFPWCDDFSAARNVSIEHATGDWILWIDADEIVKAEDILRLKTFLEESSENTFLVPINECEVDTLNPYSFYFRLKVFRNNKGYHFERAFNEQVCDQEGRVVSGQLLKNMPIYHWGCHLKEQKMSEKIGRNLNILKQQLATHPEDPYYHYFAANNYKKCQNYEAAIEEYNKAIDNFSECEDKTEAIMQKGWCYFHLRKGKLAGEAAKEVIRRDKNNADAYNLIGICLVAMGKNQDAINVFEHVKNMQPGDDSGVNLKQYKYLPHYYLGILYEKTGQIEKALKEFETAYSFEQSKEVVDKIKELSNGR